MGYRSRPIAHYITEILTSIVFIYNYQVTEIWHDTSSANGQSLCPTSTPFFSMEFSWTKSISWKGWMCKAKIWKIPCFPVEDLVLLGFFSTLSDFFFLSSIDVLSLVWHNLVHTSYILTINSFPAMMHVVDCIYPLLGKTPLQLIIKFLIKARQLEQWGQHWIYIRACVNCKLIRNELPYCTYIHWYRLARSDTKNHRELNLKFSMFVL